MVHLVIRLWPAVDRFSLLSCHLSESSFFSSTNISVVTKSWFMYEVKTSLPSITTSNTSTIAASTATVLPLSLPLLLWQPRLRQQLPSLLLLLPLPLPLLLPLRLALTLLHMHSCGWMCTVQTRSVVLIHSFFKLWQISKSDDTGKQTYLPNGVIWLEWVWIHLAILKMLQNRSTRILRWTVLWHKVEGAEVLPTDPQ